MVDEIMPNLYRAEIPLPGNPLKAVNSYVVRGDGRFLIVDTGMNREECVSAMDSALAELGVDLAKTDFFVTHLHADHLGLVSSLVSETSKVFFSERESSYMSAPKGDGFGDTAALYRLNGFPEDELERAVGSHPGHLYGPKRPITFSTLKDGDSIDIGEFSFTCIETPGHTPGHMCLYEPNKRILMSGDHILLDITPNICFWPGMDDALEAYLSSLDRVYPMDVALVLPGHRTIWNDHRQRIEELHAHHQVRLNEVLFALEEGDMTAYEIAPHVSWDLSYKSWDLFPPAQKWFATGEVIAHIIYLQRKEMVSGSVRGDKLVYSLAQAG
ncbi:MAG: MBL fold metallo-hydrolase [Chloroflexota bacterium]|nr:MBL fold metallo-hydrolase [Chloroflexota bacterium]